MAECMMGDIQSVTSFDSAGEEQAAWIKVVKKEWNIFQAELLKQIEKHIDSLDEAVDEEKSAEDEDEEDENPENL